MKNIFRYITIAAALLATAVNAGAQYNYAGGVGTSKTVTQNDAETYTIRLETFATGSTTVTESSTPVDVVLVLDVSGSMAKPKGSTQRSSKTSLSYNDVVNGSVEYFYEINNSYQRVYAEQYGGRYYLYVIPEEKYYLRSGGYTDNRNQASYANSPTAAIRRNITLHEGTSRITALHTAVCAFIDQIEKNDHEDKDGNERKERLHNQVSIVKFGGPGNTYYNENEIVMPLTRTEGNAQSLKDAVNALEAMGYTEAWEGMRLANTALAQAEEGHSKVVVMFTDGEPNGVNDSDEYAYTETIRVANTTKNQLNAVVYTIGTFDVSPASNSNTYQYLYAVSSNYLTATPSWSRRSNPNLSISGTLNETLGYYQDASGDVNLTKIFESIASSIGGSTETIGTETQVRDVVTNSFVLPDNVTTADVHVYTSAATGDASGADDKNPASWATPVEITSSVTPTIVNVDSDGNPTTDATKAKNKALFVEGFEYSKDDTSEGAGDGNWVGPRLKNKKWFWAGKKLIIEFKVKANPEATGGETLTNTGKSGVYLKDEEGNYNCINYYEQPHKTLTVNIKIRKTGLRHGESATFELMRIRPKGWDESKTPEENIPNIEYNLIGKPVPGTKTVSGTPEQSADMSDYYKELGWKGFKKIILTNKGADGAEVVKDVLVLDPYWVYMVLEDDWGWAYTMTGDTNQVGDDGTYTTSSVEVNPFRFHNEEKANAVKHAEAIRINHFKSSERDAKVEHEKSSKVESFESSN